MLKYTNSPLVTYTNLTKNRTLNRNKPIDTITIHCFVGQVTAKRGCDFFATTDRQCSANYVVGFDGSIGLSVEEKDRAWTTGGKYTVNGISGSMNDYNAVTIEVASDTKHPYAVTDKAYDALIRLVADICKRNNIKQLLWKGDKSLVGQVDKQNMTVHRWFANKACPGQYLYDRHGDIANKVNAILNGNKEDLGNGYIEEKKTLYRVQVGAYSVKSNADNMMNKLKAAGYDAFIKQVDKLYKVQVGAFSVKANAQNMYDKLKREGYPVYLVSDNVENKEEPKVEPIKVGDRVRLQADATIYGKNIKFQSWVYGMMLYVREISGNRVVISTQKFGAVTGAVDIKYLTKI